MAISLRDVEAVVRNQCFFVDFNFDCGDLQQYVEGITYPVIHCSVYGKRDGVNFKHHSICKLHPFQ